VCSFFLAGYCSFGASCRNSHAGVPGGGKGAGGKKAGKKGTGKNLVWSSGTTHGQGGGKGKDGKTFANKEWVPPGKGPRTSADEAEFAPVPPPPLGHHGGPGPQSVKALTGPYLGQGSELLKVWSMSEDVGHEDSVQAAVIMGDRVCTAGADHRLIVWRGDQSPGGGLAFVQENEVFLEAPLTALLFHAASKWLFCGLLVGQIVAFRQEPFAEVKLDGHTQTVTSFLVHEDVLLSGSQDGSVRAWKYQVNSGAFACVATIPVALGAVSALHISLPDGLWVGTERGIVCLNLHTLQPVGQLESAVRVVDLLPYQGCVLAAYADGKVRAFTAASAKEEFSHGPLGEHTTNTVAALLKHPWDNSDLLLCGQEFGYVTAYELPNFKPRGTFNTGFEGDVSAIVDMKADGIFATFGLSGDVVLWQWEKR